MEQDTKAVELGNVVRIDDERIRDHLGKIVRGSIEETLNALLEAEPDRLVGAERYERGEGRRDHRSGHYERKLQTRGGEVTLKVPRLRRWATPAATQPSRRPSSSAIAGVSARWRRRLWRCI